METIKKKLPIWNIKKYNNLLLFTTISCFSMQFNKKIDNIKDENEL